MTYYSYASLGSNHYLWVSANEHSITAIDLLSPSQLKQRKLPATRRDDERIKPFVNALIAYLKGERKEISSLPLALEEVEGSDFFHRVWRVLLTIPPGCTMTYKEIAARLGNKNKARAVGAACAANPVPLIIPCHRVVAGKGLGGYSWGLEWKRKLLRLEGVPVS